MVSHNFDWNIRKEGSDYDPLTQYDGHPELVFFEIHHGRCFTPTPNRSYVGGHVSYVDVVNIDEFCLHDLKEMVVKLGYGVAGLMYYHFLRPRLSLDYGLHLLTVDADVLELATYIKDNKIILSGSIHMLSESQDHLKTEMKMEIPSSSNVKLITECSDTTYTCYEVMKDLIKVSKLPQTLIVINFITSAQDVANHLKICKEYDWRE
ncbi:hypothetical protein Tco_0458887 [Tanacetum coccineum]